MELRAAFALLILLTAAGSAGAEEEFKPHLFKAKFVVDETVHHAALRRSPGGDGLRIGDRRIRFQGGRLVSEDIESGEQIWSAAVKAHRDGRRILAIGGGTIYLPVWRRSGGPLRVRRVGLTDGRPLGLLLVAEDATKEEEVKAALPLSGGRAIVLSAAKEPGGLSFARLTAFENGVPTWSRKLPVCEKSWCPRAGISVPGAVLRRRGMKLLADAGRDILVLAGIHEPLLFLDPDTGEETRRVDAIWEWERYFTGPSVWAYRVAPAARTDATEERARLRELRHISAGPVVVPLDEEVEAGKPPACRIFLAIDQSPSEYSRGYLVESNVVEISQSGGALSLTRLPRAVAELRAEDGGVLAIAGGSAQGFITPSPLRTSGPCFLGGGDAIGNLAWWRETVGPRLPTPMPPGEFASSSHSTSGGGYLTVTAAERTVLFTEEAMETWNLPGVLRIPIVIVHSESGREIRGEVRIPFSGPFPGSPTATRSLTREDGTEVRTLSATKKVRIRSVEPGPDGLSILLEGPDGKTTELRFDL